MKKLEQCIIEECTNEAELLATSGGKHYYSCKSHRKQVAQIVVAEHTRGELERVKTIYPMLIHEKEKSKTPTWMKI